MKFFSIDLDLKNSKLVHYDCLNVSKMTVRTVVYGDKKKI